MINEELIKDEIKRLEIERGKLCQKFAKMVDPERINYDLHNDRLINDLKKQLNDISNNGEQLTVLYLIKDKAEK